MLILLTGSICADLGLSYISCIVVMHVREIAGSPISSSSFTEQSPVCVWAFSGSMFAHSIVGQSALKKCVRGKSTKRQPYCVIFCRVKVVWISGPRMWPMFQKWRREGTELIVVWYFRSERISGAKLVSKSILIKGNECTVGQLLKFSDLALFKRVAEPNDSTESGLGPRNALRTLRGSAHKN